MAPEPKPFYPPELTERSRTVLHAVCDAVPGAILIGGWGTWVRIGGAMSHDIDLIVTHDQLGAVANLGTDTSESHHVGGQKWRTLVAGIHVDLYVPYQSRLGQALRLRVEDLAAHSEGLDRWTVLTLPATWPRSSPRSPTGPTRLPASRTATSWRRSSWTESTPRPPWPSCEARPSSTAPASARLSSRDWGT